MAGPLKQDQIDAITATEPAETVGSFVIPHKQVHQGLDGLGMWVIETLQELELDTGKFSWLLASIGKLFAAAKSIANLVIVCSGNEAPDAELSPVLPYELAVTDMRDFVKSIHMHWMRLQF
jgi:hypothetical protein